MVRRSCMEDLGLQLGIKGEIRLEEMGERESTVRLRGEKGLETEIER